VQLARRHLEDLAQSDDRSIGDLCYTSTAGRSHFSRRVAIVTTSREQLLRDLEAVVEGTTSPTVARGSTGRERPKVAFLFPDAMPADLAARELFETDTRFADAIGRSAGAFAVQHALADLWKGWGIAPDVAVGHVPTSGHEKPADGLDVRQLVDAITAAGCGMIVVMGSSEGRAVRAVQEALPSTCHVVPSLDRKTSAWFSVFTAMAALYVRGVEVDWTSGHRSRHRRTVPLTTYPFERQRYWLEQPQAARIPVGEGRDA
jgi:acyl transferase domain-containing protein